jgi:hypothetical protein
MSVTKYISAVGLTLSLLTANGAAQAVRERRASGSLAGDVRGDDSTRLTGLYRIDPASSDALYTVVADASSNLPYREQQRFFIDLAVRLTPPDQFSIAQRGRQISIASSRAPRINFEADGIAHAERGAGGSRVLTRAAIEGNRLTVSTDGGGEDKFSVSFEQAEGGRKLVVTRRIHAEGLNEPVVIRSVYDRISQIARWEIYGEPELTAPSSRPVIAQANNRPVATKVSNAGVTARAESAEAFDLARSLEEWVAATNRRDLAKHISFYMPRLKAFYLARDVAREAVRVERGRAFAAAGLLRVRAAEPETVFVEGGRVAVMRFRKQYESGGRAAGARRQSGEVIQELRWRRTREGWKIFSERDVRVLR